MEMMNKFVKNIKKKKKKKSDKIKYTLFFWQNYEFQEFVSFILQT